MSQSNDKKCNVGPQGGPSGEDVKEVEEMLAGLEVGASCEGSDSGNGTSTVTEVTGKGPLSGAARGDSGRRIGRTSFAVLAFKPHGEDDGNITVHPVVERRSNARHRLWRGVYPGEHLETPASQVLKECLSDRAKIKEILEKERDTIKLLHRDLTVVQLELISTKEARDKVQKDFDHCVTSLERGHFGTMCEEQRWYEDSCEKAEKIHELNDIIQCLEGGLVSLQEQNESLSARVQELTPPVLPRIEEAMEVDGEAGDSVDGEHKFSLGKLSFGALSIQDLKSHLVVGKTCVAPEVPGTSTSRQATTDVWLNLSIDEKFRRLVRRREEVERLVAVLKSDDALLRFEGRVSTGEDLHQLQVRLADQKSLLKKLNMAVDRALQRRILPDTLP